MVGLVDSQRLRETVNVYIAVAFGEPFQAGVDRAARLAAQNIHSALSNTLETIGETKNLTDPDVQDTSCFYEVAGAREETLAVYVSTVLPYAAILLVRGDSFDRYVTPEDDGWAGAAAAAVASHGVVILPGSLCVASSPVLASKERHYTYFELLFSSVIDAPSVPG